MTWVTVSCTVWAEAPGYMALMEICGGAIGGYWETGRVLTARRPASMIMMAITQAKIGRLMKKRGMERLLYFLATAGWVAAAAAGAAGLLSKVAALTTVPGRAFCIPSRMTRSPAFSPSLTSQLSPT